MTTRFAIVALLVVPLAASAGPKQVAKQHLAKAMKAHEDGKFDVALAELQTAYKLDPQNELLFAIGQVYVKLGKCDDARASYDKFLAKSKDPQAKPVVMQAMEACKAAEPKPEPVAEPKPEPEPPKPEPTPVPAPTIEPPKPELKPEPPSHRDSPFVDNGRSEQPSGRRAWWKDPIGDVVVVGGAVAIAVGFFEYASARAAIDDAESAQTLADYHDRLDRAHGKRTLSLVLGAGGVALVGGGVLRLKLHHHERSSTVGMTPARGGGFVTWTGRF